LFFFLAFLSISSGIVLGDGAMIFNVAGDRGRGEITISGDNVSIGAGGGSTRVWDRPLGAAIPLYLFGKLVSLLSRHFPPYPERGRVTDQCDHQRVHLSAARQTGQQLAYSLRMSVQLAMAFAFGVLCRVRLSRSSRSPDPLSRGRNLLPYRVQPRA
jgi:hypothetical protein